MFHKKNAAVKNSRGSAPLYRIVAFDFGYGVRPLALTGAMPQPSAKIRSRSD
jgi:hypothetical protein